MSQITKDRFILTQSSGKALPPNGAIKIDLNLNEQMSTIIASIEGNITTTSLTPINNALVQLYDSNFNPITHAITNSSGYYIFKNSIPLESLNPYNLTPQSQPYSFNLSAIALGKKLSYASIQLSDGQTITQNFILENDPNSILGVISGLILNQSNNEIIKGAVLSLYKVSATNDLTFVQRAFSNEFGSYLFPEISLGNYNLVIESLGYIKKVINITLSTQGQILNLPVLLQPDPNAPLGTLSGVILNNLNSPIPRADVILYRINQNGTLTPIAFTKTNSNGIYLFMNLSTGSYKIKSNEFQTIIVN